MKCRSLPCTIGSQQAHHFSTIDLQINLIHHSPTVIGLGDPLCFQNAHHSLPESLISEVIREDHRLYPLATPFDDTPLLVNEHDNAAP